jgi:hypothetical protein
VGKLDEGRVVKEKEKGIREEGRVRMKRNEGKKGREVD